MPRVGDNSDDDTSHIQNAVASEADNTDKKMPAISTPLRQYSDEEQVSRPNRLGNDNVHEDTSVSSASNNDAFNDENAYHDETRGAEYVDGQHIRNIEGELRFLREQFQNLDTTGGNYQATNNVPHRVRIAFGGGSQAQAFANPLSEDKARERLETLETTAEGLA